MELGCELTDLAGGWRRGDPVLAGVTGRLPLDELSRLPITGSSGSGKTTLMYLISAMMWPEHGRVTWHLPGEGEVTWGPGGKEMSRATARRLRRQLFGFAFQDSSIYPHYRVCENLEYPLVLRGHARADAKRRAEEMLVRLFRPDERKKGVRVFSKSFPHELSGGQRQRLALAQACIHGPSVLFADEPGGNLDVDTRKEVLATVEDWLREGDGRRAFVWVTHQNDDIAYLRAEERVVVDDGTAALPERPQRGGP